MKGVSFVTNDKNERVAVQIDLKLLEKHQESLEDYLDMVISESRNGQESISWELARQELKAAGKL